MARPAIHPGEILAGELEESGVSPTELACQIDVPPNRISQIINGKRSITGDTALPIGLGRALIFGLICKFPMICGLPNKKQCLESMSFPLVQD